MKAVIQLGYREYIMEAKDALVILEIIATAERYQQKYKSAEQGGTSYHIWKEGGQATIGGDTGSLRLISDDHYRIAKLAGEPPKD
jgi:hypothetical protein